MRLCALHVLLFRIWTIRPIRAISGKSVVVFLFPSCQPFFPMLGKMHTKNSQSLTHPTKACHALRVVSNHLENAGSNQFSWANGLSTARRFLDRLMLSACFFSNVSPHL